MLPFAKSEKKTYDFKYSRLSFRKTLEYYTWNFDINHFRLSFEKPNHPFLSLEQTNKFND